MERNHFKLRWLVITYYSRQRSTAMATSNSAFTTFATLQRGHGHTSQRWMETLLHLEAKCLFLPCVIRQLRPTRLWTSCRRIGSAPGASQPTGGMGRTCFAKAKTVVGMEEGPVLSPLVSNHFVYSASSDSECGTAATTRRLDDSTSTGKSAEGLFAP